MSSIIEILDTEETNSIIQYINNSNEIFNYINYVFSDPNEKNINNLDKLYKAFNTYDYKAIDKLKNSNDKTILEVYKEYNCNDGLLRIHIDKFISSRSFSNNILNIFKQNNNQTSKKLPNIREIVDRLEYLEKTIEELKSRVSNKDLFSDRTSS